jgi:putative transposase
MDLPYNWDFIQNSIQIEKLVELRKRFMEEWRSGKYTKEEMLERYRMSERTFYTMIKKYADAREIDDYKEESRAPKNPHRKFTDEEYEDVVKAFDDTREEDNARFSDFVKEMHADGKNLSPPKLKAQKKKIWDVRPGVRKIKAIVDALWASAKKAKTISKSCIHDLLQRFGRYPEENKKEKPKEFARPPQPGKWFSIDTATCFIGDKTKVYFQPVFDEFNSELMALVGGTNSDHTLTLKTLEELCRRYSGTGLQIRSDGGKEFNNNDVIAFYEKKGIPWIKVSKPWDNPFAERGIRTIKSEYLNMVWIGNLEDFKTLSDVIKLHYNQYRPHQSFDNKTPVQVRMGAAGNKLDCPHPKELKKWNAFYWDIPKRTSTAVC